MNNICHIIEIWLVLVHFKELLDYWSKKKQITSTPWKDKHAEVPSVL